jgi:hypothetical protein
MEAGGKQIKRKNVNKEKLKSTGTTLEEKESEAKENKR